MIHVAFAEQIERFSDLKVLLIVGTLVLAGTVKGGIGFGMPLVAVSVLANFIDLRLAAVLMICPIILSNFWVGIEGGQFWEMLKRYWMVVVSLGIGIFAGSRILINVDQHIVLAIVGAVVVIFAVIEQFKTRLRPKIPEHLTRPLGVAAGLAGGLIGGLSTVFGPPLIMYLASLRLPKDSFVRSNSVISFFGSGFLAIAFANARLLTTRTGTLSVLCVLPVFAGVYVGRWLRTRADQIIFERVVACALLLLGLSLIRRSLLNV